MSTLLPFSSISALAISGLAPFVIILTAVIVEHPGALSGATAPARTGRAMARLCAQARRKHFRLTARGVTG